MAFDWLGMAGNVAGALIPSVAGIAAQKVFNPEGRGPEQQTTTQIDPNLAPYIHGTQGPGTERFAPPNMNLDYMKWNQAMGQGAAPAAPPPMFMNDPRMGQDLQQNNPYLPQGLAQQGAPQMEQVLKNMVEAGEYRSAYDLARQAGFSAADVDRIAGRRAGAASDYIQQQGWGQLAGAQPQAQAGLLNAEKNVSAGVGVPIIDTAAIPTGYANTYEAPGSSGQQSGPGLGGLAALGAGAGAAAYLASQGQQQPAQPQGQNPVTKFASDQIQDEALGRLGDKFDVSEYLNKANFGTIGGTGPASEALTASYLAQLPGTGLSATGAGSQAAMLASQTAGFGTEGAALTAQALGATPTATTVGNAVAMAGAAIPVAALGMWLNAALTDQFGKSEPRFNFVTSSGATKGVKNNQSVESPFGHIGYGTESRKVGDDGMFAPLNAMANMDKQIAAGMTPEQVSKVKDVLVSYGDENVRHDEMTPETFADGMRRRYRDVFTAAGNDAMVDKLDSIGAYVRADSQLPTGDRATDWDTVNTNKINSSLKGTLSVSPEVDAAMAEREKIKAELTRKANAGNESGVRYQLNTKQMAELDERAPIPQEYTQKLAEVKASQNWDKSPPTMDEVLAIIQQASGSLPPLPVQGNPVPGSNGARPNTGTLGGVSLI